ncbi:hypothetical protein V8C37DRAFT_373415 [Trichoderma ceciliae]
MPPIRACDVCFKRKIQCCRPGPSLPCNWCAHQKLACTFSREKRTITAKRTKARDTDTLKLLGQIKQLESALAQANTPQCHTAVESPSGMKDLKLSIVDEGSIYEISETEERSKDSHTQVLPLARQASQTFEHSIHAHIVFATRLFGQNWYHRGLPIVSEIGLDWITSRTDRNTAALRSHLCGGRSGQPCWNFSTIQGHVLIGELWDLPDRSLVHEWLSTLSSSSFQILFPILHEVLFEETVNIAYQSFQGIHTSHTHTSARACLWAAFAVLSHLKVLGQISASISANVCAARAQRFLELANGPANLDSLQTLLLLYKYRTATGQYSSAEALHSAACRMVCELNGHSYQPKKRSETEHSLSERRGDHTRKLFWLCYLADKDLSLLSGRPPILANEYCDISVPEECLSHDVFLHASNEAVDDDNMDAIAWARVIPFVLGDPHLAVLKEKIFRLLYSPSALKMIAGELLTRIRHLDDELESWRLSLPHALRPKLSILPNHGLPSTRTFSSYLRSVQLQLEYHYLLTVIHTPVRRFGAAQGAETSPPEELHSVMHSSIDLSLEASRSTLHLLIEPIAMLRQETFWHNIIYPLVAAMSLFVNILIHPVGPQAVTDTESLALASKIVDNMRLRAISTDEAKHTEQAGELISELLTLANGAILKANGATSQLNEVCIRVMKNRY